MKRRTGLFGLVLLALVGTVSCTPNTSVPDPPTAVAATPTAAPRTATDDVPAVSGDQLVVVSLVVDPVAVAVGDTLEAVISVADVVDLYGVEVHLQFDPAVLDVVDASGATEGAKVIDGDLLKVGFTAMNVVDNDAGTMVYAISQMPPSESVSGSGVLARIMLRAEAAGQAELTIANMLLASADGVSIPLVIDVTGASAKIE